MSKEEKIETWSWVTRIPKVFLVLASLVVMLWVALIILGKEPGLTNDSIAYYSAAHNLSVGKELILFDQVKMVQWPPLYPLLLAINSQTQEQFLTIALIINGFCFVCVVILFGLIAARIWLSTWIQIFCSLAILTSYNLLEIYSMAWSEGLFITFLMFWLFTLIQAVNLGLSERRIFLLGIFTAMACLTRYAGITVWITTCGIILFYLWKSGKHVIRKLMVFTVLSLFPLFLWMIRNWLVAGSLTGLRGLMWRPLSHYLWRFFDILSGWLLPMAWPFEIRMALLFMVLASVVAWFLRINKRGLEQRSNRINISEQTKDWRTVAMVISATFISIYSVFIMVTGWLGYSADASERLLSPIFFPLLLAIVVGIDAIHRDLMGSFGGKFLLVLCFAWLLYPTARMARHLSSYLKNGRGDYTKKEWAGNETLHWITVHELEKPLYASDPAAVFWFTQKACKETAHRGRSLQEFEGNLPDKGAILIWFDQSKGFYDYDLGELKNIVNLTLIEKTADGGIYDIGKK